MRAARQSSNQSSEFLNNNVEYANFEPVECKT